MWLAERDRLCVPVHVLTHVCVWVREHLHTCVHVCVEEVKLPVLGKLMESSLMKV